MMKRMNIFSASWYDAPSKRRRPSEHISDETKNKVKRILERPEWKNFKPKKWKK